jgi:hypothetical protein
LTGLGDVRFGSKADIGLAAADVRFRVALGCPLSAISGPSALQQKKLFDHVIGLSQKRGWHSAGKTISRSSAKKRCDPLYRDRERIAVRERMHRLRAARRRQASGHRTAAVRKSGIKLLERESRCGWMGAELSSVVLTSVRQADYWRVKIAWSKTIPRYFGKFHSQTEAEKWIEEHHWLTEQRQEPDVASP